MALVSSTETTVALRGAWSTRPISPKCPPAWRFAMVIPLFDTSTVRGRERTARRRFPFLDDGVALCELPAAGDPEDGETASVREGKRRDPRSILVFSHSTRSGLVILGIARGRQFAKGHTIIKEGEPGDELFRSLPRHRRGVEERNDHRESPRRRHFGEMGLVDQAPRSATVVSVEDTSAISVDRESLLRLMRKDPSLQ